MSRTAPITPQEIDAGTRRAEPAGGASTRVTIPSHLVAALDLAPGDSLRVAITDHNRVALYAEGVPWFDDVREWVGNTTVVDHNGSQKVTVLGEAADAVGIAPGGEVQFSIKEHVIYLDSECGTT